MLGKSILQRNKQFSNLLANSAFKHKIQANAFSSTGSNSSNIGKMVIEYNKDVKIDQLMEPFSKTDPRFRKTSTLFVTGPLGKLKMPLQNFVKLVNTATDSSDANQSGLIHVTVEDPSDKKQKQMWGTTRALIKNMVTGVTEGYTSILRMVGIGYRANLETINGIKYLQLKLGYSHPVNIEIPSHIEVQVPFPTTMIVKGTDLQQVKLFAAKVREKKKPEPYNQKGIFVDSETIRKKEVKKK
ncbi:hypothetical protein BB558_000921 [Smittium angustum]|uniref:Large ribosomal subunit protein uL6 alpha-beta domain-containing protein n=1 Tax=Smittium angustum TaxID=133377 RepID=A0A2U1JD29_SMIAN|nr:hypothetical protein BB558_000921 [Smittium angustum]